MKMKIKKMKNEKTTKKKWKYKMKDSLVEGLMVEESLWKVSSKEKRYNLISDF